MVFYRFRLRSLCLLFFDKEREDHANATRKQRDNDINTKWRNDDTPGDWITAGAWTAEPYHEDHVSKRERKRSRREHERRKDNTPGDVKAKRRNRYESQMEKKCRTRTNTHTYTKYIHQ